MGDCPPPLIIIFSMPLNEVSDFFLKSFEKGIFCIEIIMMVFFCRSQSLRQLRVESQRVDGHGAGELKVLTSVVA